MNRQRLWVVPGLFPLVSPGNITLPQLDWAWSRGRITGLDSSLRLSDWPPDAPTQAQAELRANRAGWVDRAAYWLCADPIHLSIEGASLVLQDDYLLDLQQEEAEAFCAVLNECFAEEGLYFLAVSPGQWLVGLTKPADIETTPMLQRVGHSIDGYLPSGPQRACWQARFNLVQMVLHEHPLNQRRQAAGKQAISGVWFWDEAVAQHDYDILSTLRSPSAYGDVEAWCLAAQHFEQQQWAPAVAALRAGQWDSLVLVALEGTACAQLELRRIHRWRGWRPVRSMLDRGRA